MNAVQQIPAKLRRVGSRAVIYATGDVVARGLGFLLLPIYTRVLTPEAYGTYGVALSLVAILAVIVPLQMQTSVTVQYYSIGLSRRRELVSGAALCLLMSTVLTSMILLATSHLWGPFVFAGRASEPYVRLAIAIAAAAAPAGIPQALMRLREQAGLLVGIGAGFYVLGLTLGVYMLIGRGAGVAGLLVGSLAAAILAVPVYVVYMRKELTWSISPRSMVATALIALPLVPHLLAHWALNFLDRLILPRFVSLSDVGIYQLGYQAALVFQIVVLAVNSAWVPYAFQRLGNPESGSEIGQMSTWLILTQAWIGLGIALFVPEIVALIVAPSYREAVTVVPWIVLGFFFVALYHLWVNLMLFRRRTALVAIATIGAAAANLGLNLLLIPRIGYIGAAIATPASYAVLAAFTAVMAWRLRLGVSFQYQKWLASALIAIGLFLLASRVPHEPEILRWATKVFVWLGFPFLAGVLGLGGSGMLRGILGLFGVNHAPSALPK